MNMTPAPREKPKPGPGLIFPGQLLASNVRMGRAFLSLTQQDLADRMSALGHQWSRPTVSQVEREVRAVSVDELFGLAHSLETDILTLLSAHEGFRVQVGTGLPKALYPEAIRGMLTHDSPHRPNVTWKDNKPSRVEFPVDRRTLTDEQQADELGISVSELRDLYR